MDVMLKLKNEKETLHASFYEVVELTLQLITHFKFGVPTSMDGWHMTWMQTTFLKNKMHLLRNTFCFLSFSFVLLAFIKCALCLCDDFLLMGWVFVFELWWGYWVPYCKVAMLISYSWDYGQFGCDVLTILASIKCK